MMDLFAREERRTSYMKRLETENGQERIDYLNILDKTELRKYYKESIKAEDDLVGFGI